MKTNFNLRRKYSTVETLVLLVIRYDNCKLQYSTKESIHPKFWETDKKKKNFQRAIDSKSYPEHPEFNARLAFIEATAHNVFRQFLNDNNRPPHVDELRELLDVRLRKSQQKQKKNLFGFIEQFISEAKNRFNSKTGKPLAKGTIKSYLNTLVTLKKYAEAKKKRIDFDTIDLNLYHDYSEYLSIETNLANNTVGRHIKTLKAFMNEASERGFHSNYSFKSKKFKVIRENTDAIYLDSQELDEIFKLDLSDNPRLEKVRDLFLVGCWTGLRFSDFSNIQERNIQGDLIEIRTQKTDETVVIPIHKTVKQIMEKYRGITPNSLPPSVSNVKTNKALKEIGWMLGCLHVNVQTRKTKGGTLSISNNRKYELLVTHTARRSFATNLYKSGLSSITIMKITGHRTERAFLTYIKATPNENAKLLQQHWLKMEEIEKELTKVA